MSITRKLGMLFFIVGLGIVLFSAVLPSPLNIQNVKLITLAFCGIFAALFNVREEENTKLIISGGMFIIAASVFISVLQNFQAMSQLIIILSNMAFFVASILIVTAFIAVVRIASQRDEISFKKIAEREAGKIGLWDAVMMVAVVIVIVLLILELFFDISGYAAYIGYLDIIILFLFLIDLVVLYRKALNFGDFVRYNWPDIVAVIPLYSIFRIAKLVRFIRIVKILNRVRKASKITKIMKINRAMKFFSQKSGFNRYLGTARTPKKKTRKVRKKKR